MILPCMNPPCCVKVADHLSSRSAARVHSLAVTQYECVSDPFVEPLMRHPVLLGQVDGPDRTLCPLRPPPPGAIAGRVLWRHRAADHLPEKVPIAPRGRTLSFA
eukprot:TRINITY_DN1395_c0_g4_i1.p5 TRINITY_DN1395_c0_g4~~TRINITY_DN1395_c0_g4_i1.p5  ORF type:complete len:104 (+),score=2.89 TRINITY_DN1395_c0_g4_i1:3492-3803(+)